MNDFPVTGSVSTEGWVDILCFYICFIFQHFFVFWSTEEDKYIQFSGQKTAWFLLLSIWSWDQHLIMKHIFNAKCHQLNVYDTEEQEQLVPWMFSLCLHFGARLWLVTVCSKRSEKIHHLVTDVLILTVSITGIDSIWIKNLYTSTGCMLCKTNTFNSMDLQNTCWYTKDC